MTHAGQARLDLSQHQRMSYRRTAGYGPIKRRGLATLVQLAPEEGKLQHSYHSNTQS